LKYFLIIPPHAVYASLFKYFEYEYNDKRRGGRHSAAPAAVYKLMQMKICSKLYIQLLNIQWGLSAPASYDRPKV
jgi:hypothetical protein